MRFIKSVIVVAMLSMVSCKSVEQREQQPRKVKCESVVATNGNFELNYFPGKVVAATDVNLGFRVAGIVSQICKADGAPVRRGEVVACLDSRDYALQLAATQAEYDAIKAEVDRVVALYADESVSANDYDKATNGLRAITAKLEAHKNALADTKLRAPFDGYFDKSYFGRGEAVAAGTPVVSLISASAPEITIDLPTAYYIKRSNLESATAKIDIYKDINFNLKLKGISPKGNLNQLYKATFEIEPIDNCVPVAGMSAMVELKFETDSPSDVSIPFSAIVEREGESSVWIVSNNKVSLRKVEVSEIKRSGRATISSGIAAGEVIVSAGVNSLKEGQEVRVLEPVEASNVGAIK